MGQRGNAVNPWGDLLMNAESGESHIPLDVCWEFTRQKMSFNDFELKHLGNCEVCRRKLWICETAQSREHAESLMLKHFEETSARMSPSLDDRHPQKRTAMRLR